ncbi:glycosyltransferase [uncultured Pelagimonas sp.]|uniref:glycosyltransferase n=1 Tax=uncultured Pelagimonas sp. TaxID=1618102 RepID=UPI00263154EB|nr:glycosyltransferase [uncultured Pelagimonas sp.]
MSTQRLDMAERLLTQAGSKRGQPVSHILTENGQIAPRVMLGALAEADRLNQPFDHVVAAEAIVSRQEVLEAQAQHYGALALRRDVHPPSENMVGVLPAAFCLEKGVYPWMRIGETLVLATSRPDQFEALLPELPPGIGPVMMGLTLEADIHDEIAAQHGAALARHAETWVPDAASCRDLSSSTKSARYFSLAAAVLCFAILYWQPVVFFAGALILALTSLILSQGLKVAAFFALPKQQPVKPAVLPENPPRVSILVPLFRERQIAGTLVKRLSRLTYPKTLLDIVLVLEEEDTTTLETLARTQLPPWIRTIKVPPGEVMTKPRALNYAFRFTRGDIVGIYDAEDAPAPDQINKVVQHFHDAPADIGCLQGILDFYNPRANWLSRCFAVEYASWFRVLLPGLSRLRFAVPLGGTTVFFRRHVLEEVCGWDAHNVTEDADLGIRLARHGYRTELIQTVTREEANNRFWPWVKQRSRWLKGYGITWWVHTRNPRKLYADLGAWKFAGVQLIFLTTLVQFTMAPILWSFWLILFGLPHPLNGVLDVTQAKILTGIFLFAEAITILIGYAAISRSPHRSLVPWVPTLFAYFPLGTIAAYKAVWETLTKPFYWDKTEHGHSEPDEPGGDLNHH